MKLKSKAPPVMEAEDVMEVDDESSAPALEQIYEPSGKEAVRVSKPKQRILTLDDIADDAVYGLHCYCSRQFGTEHRPALGSEIKRYGSKSHEYGVIRYYAPNTRGLTETGTFHRAPKGNFLIRLADDFFCAAENFMGTYTPEASGRQVFRFSRLTGREQRVLSLRRAKQIRAELAALKKRKPKLRFKSKKKG